MKARTSFLLSLLLGILIFFTVQAQGAAPTISDIINQTTAEDTATGAINFTVLDADTPVADLTVTGTSSDQTLVPDANIALSGTGENRTVTITPALNQNGTTTITLTVSDGEQTASDSFDLTVSPVNDAPPVCSAVALNTEEDTNGAVAPSCSDVDGDTLTYSIVDQATDGVASTSATQLLYDPSNNFSGGDSFTYKANDGTADSNTANVTVTVDAVNDAPVCSTVSITTNEETTGSTAPDCTDVEGGGMTYAVVSQPTNGSAGVVAGQLEYTPVLNYTGSDPFTYRANDGNLNSTAADVNVTVNNLNDAPVAQGQSVSTAEDTAKAITLVATDIDGDGLSYAIVDQPDHGDLSGPAQVVTYTPDNNYFGPDSFTFKANDSTVDSNTATVSITVTPVNDPPSNILLSSNTVLEMIEPPVVIGSISAPDVDGGPRSFDLVTATGCASNDNNSFTISGDSLHSAVVFDFETPPDTKKICVQADDGNGGIFNKSFTINVQNKPKGSITVTPITSLTTEAGGEASFSMVLDFRPSANVSISLSSSDTTEGVIVPPTTLTFTPLNWRTPKVVTVEGVDDPVADGAKVYNIITAPAISTDPDYSGVDAVDVSMTNADDDSAGISVAPLTGLVTTEGGISRTIQVKLNTQPTSGVTFYFESLKTDEGTVFPTQLTIAKVNWQTTYEVQVTGVDDLVDDGDQPYKITISTTSPDPNYDGLEQIVNAINRDAPNIKWTSPVQTEQTYDIEDFSPFLLKVIPSSNDEPIAKVRFYRWDHVNEQTADIAEIFQPPYEFWFDPGLANNQLGDKYNQFFARAIDNQGDFIDVRILIYKLGSIYKLYLPPVLKEP